MASQSKVGRNDRCPCGSGKKYKNCCANKAGRMSPASWAAIVALAVAAGVLVFFLFNLSQGGPVVGDPACPPGQVWSPEHGHCH
jgi:SEC-C motif